MLTVILTPESGMETCECGSQLFEEIPTAAQRLKLYKCCGCNDQFVAEELLGYLGPEDFPQAAYGGPDYTSPDEQRMIAAYVSEQDEPEIVHHPACVKYGDDSQCNACNL